MAKLTNGRVTCFVADEKAEKFARLLGMRIVNETPDAMEVKPDAMAQVDEAPKRRGRPKKAE